MMGLLETVCMSHALTTLFSAKDETITAGRIRATAIEVAERLVRNRPVYLYTESAALFVSGLLAAAQKGCAVFLPAHLQPQYLREIGAADGTLLTDAKVELATALHFALAEHSASIVDLAGDLALNFYTSGVTSAPKLVPKKILQLDLEAQTLDYVWGNRAGRVCATVSHQHIYGMLFRVFWPVISGRVSDDRPADTWEKLTGKLSPDVTLVSSPAHLTRIPDALRDCTPGLIFTSGAPLPFAAAQNSRERFGSLPFEVLGSTETGGIAWRQQNKTDTLWTPFPGVQVSLDEIGVLNVTSATAGDRPVVIGDLAEMVGDQFRLKGRADKIAKIDGSRVSLPRVEEALSELSAVEAAAVVDLPQRKGALGAIVELSAAGTATLREIGAFRLSRNLREQLVGRMEPRERPKHWLFAPIPVDRQGKRVQAMLRAKFVQSDTDALGYLLAAALDGDKAELTIELQPELIWFQGHFPNEPLLPGIAQVHMAVQWAECMWGFRPLSAELSQVKFRRILRPGSRLRLTLVRDLARQRLSFAYEFDGITASEGKIGGVT